jgi:hypothetical protein
VGTRLVQNRVKVFQAYPERTVYEITDAGRAVAREWLLDMLAMPKQEFPEFPAALSHLVMLAPQEISDRRVRTLSEALAGLEAEIGAETGHGLPRITMLEAEYLRVVTAAELQWLRSVVDELRNGELTWSAADLLAFAESPD